ncbi:MAG: hypothetical protein WC628_01345 [Candidatus Omnitrophota bacterium]
MKIILTCLFTLLLPLEILAAQPQPSAGEKLIGSTFKTLAKAFVASADIEKIKADNLRKIRKMPQEKFQRRYDKIYQVIKDLPDTLKKQYNISENLSREEAISLIQPLNKEGLYKIIDAITDSFITCQFLAYLRETKQKLQQNDFIQQIHRFWKKITLQPVGNFTLTD